MLPKVLEINIRPSYNSESTVTLLMKTSIPRIKNTGEITRSHLTVIVVGPSVLMECLLN